MPHGEAGELSAPEAIGAIAAKDQRRAHLLLVLVQVAFASQAVEAKIAMAPRAAGGEAIDALALTMVRMIAGTLAMAAWWRFVARPAGRRVPATLRARDHLVLAGLAVLGIDLNQALFLLGLHRTSPISAALLMPAIPVFTAALAAAFGKERLSARTALGLGAAAAGSLVLVGVTSVDAGIVLVLCNSLAYAAYLVLGRDVVLRLGALRSVVWVFAWGTLFFVPVGLAPAVHGVVALTPRGVGFVAWIVLVPTVFAYLANAWALGRVGATTVTAYVFLQPLLAALLAWVQLGLAPTGRAVLAAPLVALGVVLVATRRR